MTGGAEVLGEVEVATRAGTTGGNGGDDASQGRGVAGQCLSSRSFSAVLRSPRQQVSVANSKKRNKIVATYEVGIGRAVSTDSGAVGVALSGSEVAVARGAELRESRRKLGRTIGTVHSLGGILYSHRSRMERELGLA